MGNNNTTKTDKQKMETLLENAGVATRIAFGTDLVFQIGGTEYHVQYDNAGQVFGGSERGPNGRNPIIDNPMAGHNAYAKQINKALKK